MKKLIRRAFGKQEGSALVMVLIFSVIALVSLASAIGWTTSSTRFTAHNNQYFDSVAAAEAATEKVLGRISADFHSGGAAVVFGNLSAYQDLTPTTAEWADWANWDFSDAQSNIGRTYVSRDTAWGYVVLDSAYTGLSGHASTYSIVSNARRRNTNIDVTGALRQEIQIATIPVFQFAMFYNLLMEISCGQPFNVTGRVHSNQSLYVEPDSTLTFKTHVTAVGDINFARAPGDGRAAPDGTVTYDAEHDGHTAHLNMPIGTNNTPQAVRAIIEVPPVGENMSSAMGKQRLYNKVEVILRVTNTGTTLETGPAVTSHVFVPTNEISLFVRTNSSFVDNREGKTVRPIDINVAALKTWSETNNNVRAALTSSSKNFSSIYIVDERSQPAGTLNAVRVHSGTNLPTNGLTVVTARPLYIRGHYNQTNNAHLGTTNTTKSRPAAFMADAVSVLSENWTDANSTSALDSRNASDTTINAAILAGIVETTTYNSYSGGVENFPRFLERWTGDASTINGSMVVMFASQYATGMWGKANVYAPPARKWAFDMNFKDSTKLPPHTPSLSAVIRGSWTTLPAGTTVASY